MKRALKISSGLMTFVLAVAGLVSSTLQSDTYQQVLFNSIWRKAPDNIVAVGPNFIGVIEKSEDIYIPAGYTFDQVHEIGEIVFHVDDPTPEVCSCTSKCNCQCACPTCAAAPTEAPTAQPTEIATDIPDPTVTATPVPEPSGDIVYAHVSGVGQNIYGTKVSACTRGPRVFYRDGTMGFLVNAHCATQVETDFNDNAFPGYAVSAGPWISPSTADGGTQEDAIGETWYWWPNLVNQDSLTALMMTYDAGVIKTYEQNPDLVVVTDELPEITSIYELTPAIGTKMISEGRTTYVVTGEAIGTEVTAYVRVRSKGVTYTVPFAHQIVVEGFNGAKVSLGGDSGKIWRLFSNQTMGVCQNWGGNINGTYSVCSPLSIVFSGMHVSLVKP